MVGRRLKYLEENYKKKTNKRIAKAFKQDSCAVSIKAGTLRTCNKEEFGTCAKIT